MEVYNRFLKAFIIFGNKYMNVKYVKIYNKILKAFKFDKLSGFEIPSFLRFTTCCSIFWLVRSFSSCHTYTYCIV